MDVAIKVVEHDGSSYAAVEEEMDMMMSFNDPNIVRWAGRRQQCQSAPSCRLCVGH